MHAAPTVDRPASDDQARSSRRADRFAARAVLWDESTLPRVRECGAVGVMPGGGIAVRVSGAVADGTRRAGFAGLSTCGSTWACPCCSAKIATHRALELGAAVAQWHAWGGQVVMVTLTQRHHRGQALADLWDVNGYAWGKVTSGRGWKGDQASYGIAGWVRVVEVTHGAHGWHVHVHALLFLDAGMALDGFDPRGLGVSMFRRWRDALVRKDQDAPLKDSGGLDVRTVGRGDAVQLGDYFTKATYTSRTDESGVGFEVAAGSQKTARHGNRTPFAILADVVALGEVDDLALWHEWEAGSHGRRQLTWARGFRAQVLMTEAELSDQEVVDRDEGGEDAVCIPASGVRRLSALRAHGRVSDAAEADDDGTALRRLLDELGIDWRWPDER